MFVFGFEPWMASLTVRRFNKLYFFGSKNMNHEVTSNSRFLKRLKKNYAD
ncbi:hypothetical protein LguiA_006011 [Lonicera macranthoides]